MPLSAACNRLDWFRATCNYIRNCCGDPFGRNRSLPQRIASLSCSANASRKFCAFSESVSPQVLLCKVFCRHSEFRPERLRRESHRRSWMIHVFIDFNLCKSLKIFKNHRIRLFSLNSKSLESGCKSQVFPVKRDFLLCFSNSIWPLKFGHWFAKDFLFQVKTLKWSESAIQDLRQAI